MPIKFQNLRNLDYGFTRSMNLFPSGIIAAKSAGFTHTYDRNVGTHEFRVVRLDHNCSNVPVVALFEMVYSKDGQKGDLKLHFFSDYLKGGFFDSYIVDIKRSPVYDDVAKSNAAIQWLFTKWQEGRTGYDWGGCGKWSFPFLKDKQDKFYCSEISEYIDQTFGGFSCVNNKKGNDDVIPYQHQTGKLISVDWRG